MSSTTPVFENDQVNSYDMMAWPLEPFEVNADGETNAQDFADMADAYSP